MSRRCQCGSYAINLGLYGRDSTDIDLCDVCYWRKKYNDLQAENTQLKKRVEYLEKLSLSNGDKAAIKAGIEDIKAGRTVPLDLGALEFDDGLDD